MEMLIILFCHDRQGLNYKKQVENATAKTGSFFYAFTGTRKKVAMRCYTLPPYPRAIPPGINKTHMESKIMIDIDDSGRPFIYVEFKGSEDLRDKVLSRFFTRAGAFSYEPDKLPSEPIPLELHLLWFNPEKQRLQAMIEVPEVEKGTQITCAQVAQNRFPENQEAQKAFLAGFNWAYEDKPGTK